MSKKLPLCSSKQVIQALERLGFKRGPVGSGSHQSFKKPLSDGETLVTIVVLGKKEIPRGTLEAILKQAHVSKDEFLRHLKS